MSKEFLKYNVPYILNGEFYEIIALDGENVTVRCCHCESRNIYKGSIRSTGNFHMHIKRKHPILLPRVQEVKLNSFLNRKIVPRKRNMGTIVNSNQCEGEGNKEINYMTKPLIETLPESVRQKPEISVTTVQRSQPQFSVQGEVKIEEEINIEEISEKSCNTSKDATSRSPMDGQKNSNVTTPESQRMQWEEAMFRLENLMKGIERELRLRNQIETNRLFLELAKFKYLHPQFNFNT